MFYVTNVKSGSFKPATSDLGSATANFGAEQSELAKVLALALAVLQTHKTTSESGSE